MADTARIMASANRLGVVCGGCGQVALPLRVRGVVLRPQFGTAPFADVEFRCQTAGCDSAIHVEVDIV